jgi:hypothetical protein
MDPGVSSCVSLPVEGQRNTDVGSAWMPRIGFNWPINFVILLRNFHVRKSSSICIAKGHL